MMIPAERVGVHAVRLDSKLACYGFYHLLRLYVSSVSTQRAQRAHGREHSRRRAMRPQATQATCMQIVHVACRLSQSGRHRRIKMQSCSKVAAKLQQSCILLCLWPRVRQAPRYAHGFLIISPLNLSLARALSPEAAILARDGSMEEVGQVGRESGEP